MEGRGKEIVIQGSAWQGGLDKEYSSAWQGGDMEWVMGREGKG